MLLVVLHRSGPRWDPSRPHEEQSDWDAHAAFMDGLVDTGFIVLAGRSPTSTASCMWSRPSRRRPYAQRSRAIPWSESHLRVDSIEPCTIRLDARRG
jgi:hypothetical protein